MSAAIAGMHAAVGMACFAVAWLAARPESVLFVAAGLAYIYLAARAVKVA